MCFTLEIVTNVHVNWFYDVPVAHPVKSQYKLWKGGAGQHDNERSRKPVERETVDRSKYVLF